MTIREFINQRDWRGARLNHVAFVNGKMNPVRKLSAEWPKGHNLAVEAHAAGLSWHDCQRLCAAMCGFNEKNSPWWNPLIRKQLRDAIRRANSKTPKYVSLESFIKSYDWSKVRLGREHGLSSNPPGFMITVPSGMSLEDRDRLCAAIEDYTDLKSYDPALRQRLEQLTKKDESHGSHV
jgi:hypothetical protein